MKSGWSASLWHGDVEPIEALLSNWLSNPFSSSDGAGGAFFLRVAAAAQPLGGEAKNQAAMSSLLQPWVTTSETPITGSASPDRDEGQAAVDLAATAGTSVPAASASSSSGSGSSAMLTAGPLFPFATPGHPGDIAVLFSDDLRSGLLVDVFNRTLLPGGPDDMAGLGPGTDSTLVLFGGFSSLTSLPVMPRAIDNVVVTGAQDYSLSASDALVAAGARLVINAEALIGGHTIVFDGSAETDGAFVFLGGAGDDSFRGGAGNDRIWGGLGADVLNGGAGADTFHYEAANESTGSGYDQIVGFVSGTDKIDLPGTVAAVDTTVNGGVLNAASFNADLSAAIGAGQLHAGDAVLFHPDSGTLAGTTFLIVDANGIAGYQADQDYVIQLVTPPPVILPTDFV